MIFITLWPIENQQNYNYCKIIQNNIKIIKLLKYNEIITWCRLMYLNVIKAMPLLGIYINQKKFRSTLLMNSNISNLSF